jgi:hypothetical protein
MTSTSCQDNDEFILSVLVEPRNKNSGEKVTKDNLLSVYKRIVDDVSSPLSNSSFSGSFWENIVSKVSSLGFSIRHGDQVGFDSDGGSSRSIVEDGNLLAPPFDTNDGKRHLSAVSSLLGVTHFKAKVLTERVLEVLKQEKCANGENPDDAAINSLIGTKELLLQVRDFHYEQQVERIQIITESIRIETAEDLELNSDKSQLRENCVEFLDFLDRSDSWSTSSRESEQGPFKRGLFKLLLCLSCAPVKAVGREEIYGACDLRDGSAFELDKSSHAHFSSALARNPDFARLLVEQHYEHHHVAIRTVALETLFMLLYQRIDGGIDRTDYMIILQAMKCQEFFVDLNRIDGDNRKSQLASLVLAECMSLWRTSSSRSIGSTIEPSSDSHPFLTNDETAVKEIEIIANVLRKEMAVEVLERRRIFFSQTSVGTTDEDKIEEPEAIALLTFGLLMKLCHRKAALDTWKSDAKIKDIAMDCVSCANNDCGAFGYLGKMMSCLLPPSIFIGSQTVSNNFEAKHGTDENECKSFESFQDGEEMREESRATDEEHGHDSTSVIYASIGREILVATLSAFQSSLSNTLEASKIDNLGMFCQLAAKIHCNSDVLCQRFWMDWEDAPRDMSASGVENIDFEQADPLTILLDLSHSVAMRALSKLDDRSGNVTTLSTEQGRQEAAILPCLTPLLSMLASLIPPGNDSVAIFQAFLVPEVINVALLGILHVCSKEQMSAGVHDSNDGDRRRSLDAARTCMESISVLSIISARDSNNVCCEWLKKAIYGGNNKLGGPDLLQRIAQVAQANSTLENFISVDITSFALSVMSHLCYHGKSCSWVREVAKCLSSLDRTDVQFFAGHINQVSKCFTFLLYQLSCSLGNVIETGSIEENVGFMKDCTVGSIFACEIIAAAPNVLDLSDTHISILSNAIAAVTSSLRGVNCILRFNKNTDVVNEAINIRDKILHIFTKSTSLGSNIGLLALVNIIEKNIELKKTNPVKVSFPFQNNITSDEKKDGYSSDLSIEYCSTAVAHRAETILMSHKAFQLLGAWNDVAEQIAIESLDSKVKSLRNIDINDLYLAEKGSLSSTYMNYGPSYLLQSSVPGLTCSYLILLAKYVSWYFGSKSHSSYVFADITLKSVELLSSVIMHTTINDVGEPSSSSSWSSLEYAHRRIGIEMQNALGSLLDMDFCSMDMKNFILVTKFFAFLRATVQIRPNLARCILSGEKSEMSPIDLMMESMKRFDITVNKEAVMVSSILEILQLIWKQSRNKIKCEWGIKDLKRIHPFAHIVNSLATSNELCNVCVLMLEKSSALLRTQSQFSASHRTTLKHIIYNSLQIIEEDVRNLLEETTDDNLAPVAMILQRFARNNTVDEWLQCVGSFTTVFSALKSFTNQNKSGAMVEIIPTITDASNTYLTINRTQSVPRAMISNERASRYFDTLCHEIIVECKTSSAICRVGEMVHCSYLQDPADAESVCIKIAQTSIEKLYQLAEDMLSLHVNIEISSTSLPVYELLECFNAMLHLSFSCMSKICSKERIPITLAMLDKVLRSCSRALALENPDCTEPFLVLRLNVQCFAILVMNILHRSDELKLGSAEEHLYKSCRIVSCSIACDSLRWLRRAKLDIRMNALNRVPTDVLQTAVMLLTFIIPNVENVSKSGTRTMFQSFQLDLTELLQHFCVFDVISYHLERACKCAALLRHQKEMIGNPAFGVVESILAFVFAVCGNIELLAALISNSQLLQVVLKNSLLIATSEYWAELKHNGTALHRGYVQKHESSLKFTTGSQEHEFVKDPAHEVWRKTLQIVSAILHVTAENQNYNQYFLVQEQAAASAIDFLHRFEVDIRFFTESYLDKESLTDTKATSSSPKSGVVFTFAMMTELSDIMALASELCSGLHRKQFESTSPNLYKTITHAALDICRSLSSFLGALGTARELFTALKSLNEVMDTDITNSSKNSQYRHLASNPLLSEGLPNAKHQAIRNALYASSYCSSVTSEEHSLTLCSVTKIPTNTPENLEQSFHRYVNNSFICLMEEVAGKCLLSALTVIHKVHPNTTAFVTFTAEESKHLDLSSSPPIGAMVVIRSVSSNHTSGNILSPSQILRHGKVIHFNSFARQLDVEYFDNLWPAAERKIELGRLAALEDVTKRINIFEYKPAPYSVSDSDSSTISGHVSLGNLILILRWCQEHAPRIMSSSSAHGSSFEIMGIANLASIILGNEIGLHMELNSPAFVPENVTKEINSQLLDLFDNETYLQNFALDTPYESLSRVPTLQRIIDAEIWKSVYMQLEGSLMAARVDRDSAVKNSEQTQPLSANFWVRRTPTGVASRRSPFR